MISTHSNGIHDKLAPLVITGSTMRNVVRVVLCSKVMTQLVCGYQICLLDTSRPDLLIVSHSALHKFDMWRKKVDLGKDGFAIVLGAGQSCVQKTGLLHRVGRKVCYKAKENGKVGAQLISVFLKLQQSNLWCLPLRFGHRPPSAWGFDGAT